MDMFRGRISRLVDLIAMISLRKNKTEKMQYEDLVKLINMQNLWNKVYFSIDYKNYNEEQLGFICEKLRKVISNITSVNNSERVGKLYVISKKLSDGLRLRIVNDFGDDAKKFDHYVNIYDSISRKTDGELMMEGRAKSLRIILEYQL